MEITDNCGSLSMWGKFLAIYIYQNSQEASKKNGETFCGRTTGQSHEAETEEAENFYGEHLAE